MALIGAITRLTQSGLSITDWRPIMGAIPPLNDADWQHAFDGYKQIPQYQILNRGMSLAEFKSIFFWEWLHRLWGRVIGLVFLLPFLWFLAKRQIDRRLGFWFAALFLLGGLQGFIGWFMVKSGLDVRTSVSPYRLALHLGFALLLYSLMLWTALGLRRGNAAKEAVTAGARRLGWAALGLLAVTMCWGAFTAGLHAGAVYNTWPLMEGDVVPGAAFTLLPRWVNVFANPALVQFTHRWLGPATMLLLLGFVARRWPTASPAGRFRLWWLAFTACAQVILGIATVLSHAWLPLAVLHQAGAITLLTLLLVNLERLTPLP